LLVAVVAVVDTAAVAALAAIVRALLAKAQAAGLLPSQGSWLPLETPTPSQSGPVALVARGHTLQALLVRRVATQALALTLFLSAAAVVVRTTLKTPDATAVLVAAVLLARLYLELEQLHRALTVGMARVAAAVQAKRALLLNPIQAATVAMEFLRISQGLQPHALAAVAAVLVQHQTVLVALAELVAAVLAVARQLTPGF
jgi:hypothetical protein